MEYEKKYKFEIDMINLLEEQLKQIKINFMRRVFEDLGDSNGN